MTLLEELRDWVWGREMLGLRVGSITTNKISRAIAAIEHMEQAPLPSAWPDALDEPLPYADWHQRSRELLK